MFNCNMSAEEILRETFKEYNILGTDGFLHMADLWALRLSNNQPQVRVHIKEFLREIIHGEADQFAKLVFYWGDVSEEVVGEVEHGFEKQFEKTCRYLPNAPGLFYDLPENWKELLKDFFRIDR